MDKAVWDEDKLNKLKSLWEEGLPITKIGVELGVSRNAIAGKAHRMNLPKRNSPISKLGDPRKNQKKDDEQNGNAEQAHELLHANIKLFMAIPTALIYFDH